MIEFRKPYTQKSVSVSFPEQGRTKQSHKDECDINKILIKYQKTGLLEFVNKNQPQYGDFSGFDFMNAMNTVAKASEMFDQLPAAVRKRFNNEPGEFMTFVDDPANTDEAIRLGLATKREPAPLEPVLSAPKGSEPVGQA